MDLAGLGEVAGGAGVACVGGVGHVAGECRSTARDAAAQPTRSSPAYTLSASPRAKPMSVIRCSRASAIASEVGAPTPTRIGAARDRRLLDELEREPAADAEHELAQRHAAVEQRAADHLVHRVVAPDVLAHGEQGPRRVEQPGRVQAARCGRSAGCRRAGARAGRRAARAGRRGPGGRRLARGPRPPRARPCRRPRTRTWCRSSGAPGVAQQRTRDLDDVRRRGPPSARRSCARSIRPSPRRNPSASSSSWPGVRIVTASGSPSTRISSGSSTATSSRSPPSRSTARDQAAQADVVHRGVRPPARRAPACATAPRRPAARRPRSPCTPGTRC